LKENIIPTEFVADNDYSAEHYGRLLKNLARPWSLFRPARAYRRHKASGPSKICAGIEAIHYFVSGKEFAQPVEANLYSRQDFEALFAFRRTIQTTQPMVYLQGSMGLACETWEMLDQSATGFRLMRASFGRRIEPGQLLAIRAGDSEAYLLVTVAWLMQEQTGALLAGLAALPGKPQAVAVRRVWQQSESAVPFERGFLLPAVPAINAEQTIILPPGWFHPNSLVEVYTDKSWCVRLVRLLADGPDFERATFVAS
jgi:hypothetical protein